MIFSHLKFKKSTRFLEASTWSPPREQETDSQKSCTPITKPCCCQYSEDAQPLSDTLCLRRGLTCSGWWAAWAPSWPHWFTITADNQTSICKTATLTFWPKDWLPLRWMPISQDSISSHSPSLASSELWRASWLPQTKHFTIWRMISSLKSKLESFDSKVTRSIR